MTVWASFLSPENTEENLQDDLPHQETLYLVVALTSGTSGPQLIQVFLMLSREIFLLKILSYCGSKRTVILHFSGQFSCLLLFSYLSLNFDWNYNKALFV